MWCNFTLFLVSVFDEKIFESVCSKVKRLAVVLEGIFAINPINGNKVNMKDFWQDFAIEHGIKYKYAM